MSPRSFWQHVPIGSPDSCWIWTGATDSRGYGRYGQGWTRGAHRLVAAAILGRRLDRSECVCHHCDNPTCVNPLHLFIGDYAANNRDRDRKGRTARGDANGSRTKPWTRARGARNGMNTRPEARLVGAKNPNARGDDAFVRSVVSHYRGSGSYSATARTFGLAVNTVRNWNLGKHRVAACKAVHNKQETAT